MINNSNEEILNAYMEMDDLIENGFNETPKSLINEAFFYSLGKGHAKYLLEN